MVFVPTDRSSIIREYCFCFDAVFMFMCAIFGTDCKFYVYVNEITSFYVDCLAFCPRFTLLCVFVCNKGDKFISSHFEKC